MNLIETQLQKKKAQFEDEYNLYCANSLEKLRQDNAAISGSGSCITLFIELQNKLIGQYFVGFDAFNGIFVQGYIHLYDDYLKLINYNIKNETIKEINGELLNYWEKRLLQLEDYFKSHYQIANQFDFRNNAYEFSLKPTYQIEVKRFVSHLQDLKLFNKVPIHKKIFNFLITIGALGGFITVFEKMKSIIWPIVNNFIDSTIALLK